MRTDKATGPDQGTITGSSGGPLASRRAFLVGSLAAASAAFLDPSQFAAARTRAAALPAGELFPLGVASGDPNATSVILWTRLLSPDAGPAASPLPAGDIAVDWTVATDQAFTTIVASGTAPAVAALGHSVHIDATGLAPDTTYWYRFAADGRPSATGRTRTFPDPASTPDEVRFALTTCQNYADGYYTAHANLATDDVAFVVFVGDYIYESSANRPPRPLTLAESVDLPTYRARYELYKADTDLQACHHAHPWILTVDDHEVANNVLGDFGKKGVAEGDPAAIAAYRVRRADAFQAWYEHQPLRLAAPNGADYVIYRTVEHSKLLRFFVLDGRQYRSTYPSPGVDQGPDDPQRLAEDRTMLGATQEAWLDGQFAATDARWNAIAQQTVMTATPIPVGDTTFYNFDQWDGYVAGRNRLLRSLVTNQVRNPMVLSGDMHLGAAGGVRLDYRDPSAPDIANEVVTTSISSRFDPALLDLVQAAVDAAPWARYGNARDRGYARITVTADEWRTDFQVVAVTEPTATARTDFTDVVADRDPIVLPPATPVAPEETAPPSPPRPPLQAPPPPPVPPPSPARPTTPADRTPGNLVDGTLTRGGSSDHGCRRPRP